MNLAKPLLSAVLYVALSVGAIPVHAGTLSPAELRDMRAGEMRKLAVHKQPADMPRVEIEDMQGNARRLDEFRGKYVLLNFWATWCAPCRAEMPSLAALQEQMGSDRFQVLLVAVGHNPKPAITRFFKDIKVTNLTTLRDPGQRLSGQAAVFGLPTTVILDPDGKEIARMVGDANWSSPEALSLIKGLLGG